MAKTTRWTGGHGSSNNWSQTLNWDNGVPVAGDTIEFAGTTRLSPNNDIVADTSFAALKFINGAGAFTIGGIELQWVAILPIARIQISRRSV